MTFTINGITTPGLATTTYGGACTLACLDTQAAAVSWSVEAASAATTVLPTITPGGVPYGMTATFTFPSDPGHGRGVALRIKCQVIRVNGQVLVYKGVVGVAGNNGLVPITYQEATDRGAYGYADELNRAVTGTGYSNVSSTGAGMAPSFTAAVAAVLKTDGTYSSWGTIQPALLDSGIPVSKLGSYVAGDVGKVLSVSSTGAVVAALSVPRTITSAHVATFPDGGVWSLVNGVPTQGSIANTGSTYSTLRAQVGDVLSSVRIYLQPGVHAALPATKPYALIERRLITGTSAGAWTVVSGFAGASDPSATYTAYNQLHYIELKTGGNHTIEDGYEYRITLYGETGTNSVTGLALLSQRITFA